MIEVDTSITGRWVAAVLDRLADTRCLLESITVDHDPEFEGQAFDMWAYHNRVCLALIRLGQADRERLHREELRWPVS